MLKIILTALAVCFAMPALAQNNCAPRENVSAKLTDKYGEAPSFIGVNSKGIITIWINQKTGTWSAVLTNPSGISCVVSVGRNGELLDLPPAGDPA